MSTHRYRYVEKPILVVNKISSICSRNKKNDTRNDCFTVIETHDFCKFPHEVLRFGITVWLLASSLLSLLLSLCPPRSFDLFQGHLFVCSFLTGWIYLKYDKNKVAALNKDFDMLGKGIKGKSDMDIFNWLIE